MFMGFGPAEFGVFGGIVAVICVLIFGPKKGGKKLTGGIKGRNKRSKWE